MPFSYTIRPPTLTPRNTNQHQRQQHTRVYLRSSNGFSTYSSSSSSSLGRVAGGEFVLSSDTGFLGSSPILAVPSSSAQAHDLKIREDDVRTHQDLRDCLYQWVAGAGRPRTGGATQRETGPTRRGSPSAQPASGSETRQTELAADLHTRRRVRAHRKQWLSAFIRHVPRNGGGYALRPGGASTVYPVTCVLSCRDMSVW